MCVVCVICSHQYSLSVVKLNIIKGNYIDEFMPYLAVSLLLVFNFF